MSRDDTAEHRRLVASASKEENWQRSGTYLPERQWGTVREDTSPDERSGHLNMMRHARPLTDQERTDCSAGPIANVVCVSRWHCGTAKMGTSRNGSSGSRTGRAITARMSRSCTTISMPFPHIPTRTLFYKYPQSAFPYEDLREKNHSRGYDASVRVVGYRRLRGWPLFRRQC